MRKKLQDCKFFFLDSGVVIDRMKIDVSASPVDVQNRVKIIKAFFEALSDPFQFGTQKKVFQISAITLAEIFHIDNHQDKTVQAILQAFDGQNVEILSFENTTATFHNKEFYSLLSEKELKQIKELVNYPTSQYSNIRDRIRKDMMIAATAKMYRSDVVLTNDGGFKNLCDRLNIFCHCFTSDASQFIRGQHNDEVIYDFADSTS